LIVAEKVMTYKSVYLTKNFPSQKKDKDVNKKILQKVNHNLNKMKLFAQTLPDLQ